MHLHRALRILLGAVPLVLADPRRSKYGIKTLAQALEFEKKVKKKQLEKKWANLDPSTKTLGAFKAEYLAHRKGLNLSPHTKKQDPRPLTL